MLFNLFGPLKRGSVSSQVKAVDTKLFEVTLWVLKASKSAAFHKEKGWEVRKMKLFLDPRLGSRAARLKKIIIERNVKHSLVLCHYDFNVFGFLTVDWLDKTGNLKTKSLYFYKLDHWFCIDHDNPSLLQQYLNIGFLIGPLCVFLFIVRPEGTTMRTEILWEIKKKGLSPSKEEIMTASSTYFHYELNISLRSHPHCWLKQGFNHIPISSGVWAALMDVTFSTSEDGKSRILQIHHNVLTCPTEQLWSL